MAAPTLQELLVCMPSATYFYEGVTKEEVHEWPVDSWLINFDGVLWAGTIQVVPGFDEKLAYNVNG